MSDREIRLTEEDERWAVRLLGGKDHAEVGVCRDDDPIFLRGSCEDFLVSGRLHSVRSDVNRIMARRHKQAGQLWW